MDEGGDSDTLVWKKIEDRRQSASKSFIQSVSRSSQIVSKITNCSYIVISCKCRGMNNSFTT